MAKRTSKREPTKKPIKQYDHKDKKRANNPPVGLVTSETDPDRGKKQTYEYDPHLDLQRIWAKREKQIDRVLTNTVGLHGDVAGIIGGTLPEIAAIELKALAADTASANEDTDDEASSALTRDP